MYLDLQFSAVMQSWGIKEEWYHSRRTDITPGLQAIAGLIGRSMGVMLEDEEGQRYIADNLKSVTPLSVNIPDRMTDDQVTYIKDYYDWKIAGVDGFPSAAGGRRISKDVILSQVFTKDYVVDTVSSPVVVAIEGSREFLERVKDALTHPVYPPYLGRYCCIPAKPIVVNGEIYETLCLQG